MKSNSKREKEVVITHENSFWIHPMDRTCLLASSKSRTHHDTTVKGTAARTAIQPNHHGIWNGLCGRFKQPKHHFSSTVVVVAGKCSGLKRGARKEIKKIPEYLHFKSIAMDGYSQHNLPYIFPSNLL
jgi:hypothetical protein